MSHVILFREAAHDGVQIPRLKHKHAARRVMRDRKAPVDVLESLGHESLGVVLCK